MPPKFQPTISDTAIAVDALQVGGFDFVRRAHLDVADHASLGFVQCSFDIIQVGLSHACDQVGEDRNVAEPIWELGAIRPDRSYAAPGEFEHADGIAIACDGVCVGIVDIIAVIAKTVMLHEEGVSAKNRSKKHRTMRSDTATRARHIVECAEEVQRCQVRPISIDEFVSVQGGRLAKNIWAGDCCPVRLHYVELPGDPYTAPSKAEAAPGSRQ